MLSNDACPNTSGGLQGFTPGFTETLMYHLRYTRIFIPDFDPEEYCMVKERHLCPWIKRNNLQNTFIMGQNDCLLFGIEFVFQGLSHRVTIPDIWKFEKGIFNASVAPRKFCYNFIPWEQQNNFLGPRPCFVKNLNFFSWGHLHALENTGQQTVQVLESSYCFLYCFLVILSCL